jgi:large subunit ribosomal protein L4
MPEQSQPSAAVTLPLYSAAQEHAGEAQFSGAVFGREGEASLLHDAVRMQLANRRSGTAATKTRGLISGGGRKPWRQKGTGRARAGSTRSPLWRHGGTIFGPQPRDYSYQIPKKAWRGALCLALSQRAKEGKLFVVQSLAIAEPKTKLAKAALDKLGLKHALVIIGEGEDQFQLAARNLASHKVLAAAGLNVYDLLNYDELVMSEATARAIEKRLAGDAR